MTANAANRETCRDKLAALFSTALTGVGKPAQAVYGYQLGDFAGASPVVLIVSAGSQREQATLGTTKYNNTFRFLVMNFVSAANAAASWTEAQVEDALDLLEKSEADVVADDRGKSNDASLPWDYIELETDFSEIHSATVGGAKYWLETLIITATVKNQ